MTFVIVFSQHQERLLVMSIQVIFMLALHNNVILNIENRKIILEKKSLE